MSNVQYIETQETRQPRGAFSPAQQAVLDEINQKIASGLTLADVMDFLFAELKKISRCDRLGLAFLEENNTRVVAHLARADYEPILLRQGYTEDLAGSSLEGIIRTGRPRIINDLALYLERRPASVSTQLIVQEGVLSSMTCPLYVDDRIVGLFFRSSKTPNAYDDTQVSLHLAMAERLSQAVEKAWLIEKLEKTNHAYLEMLGFVSHELKNPLSAVLADTYTLREELIGPVSEKQKAVILRIEKKADYIANLVREYLDLSRVEAGSLRVSMQANVDFVAEVIEASIDIVRPQIEQEQVILECKYPDTPFRIACDPDLMKIVMVNLVSNAVKYGNKGAIIRVSARIEENNLIVSVWNQGPGFSPEDRERLFKRFSRLQSPELLKRKGTGVGLYAAWKIVQLHKGKIWADSEKGQWAEFTFRMPVDLTP